MRQTITISVTLSLTHMAGEERGEIETVGQLVRDLDDNVMTVDGSSYMINVEKVEAVP